MARIKQRAKEHGVNPKSHGEHGWAGSIMRKSERFLERHGERLQYDKGTPSISKWFTARERDA